jgi:hypothetical protein
MPASAATKPPRYTTARGTIKRAARLQASDSFGGVDSALCYERLNPTVGGDEFKRIRRRPGLRTRVNGIYELREG